jgi:hypothetical protein
MLGKHKMFNVTWCLVDEFVLFIYLFVENSFIIVQITFSSDIM